MTSPAAVSNKQTTISETCCHHRQINRTQRRISKQLHKGCYTVKKFSQENSEAEMCRITCGINYGRAKLYECCWKMKFYVLSRHSVSMFDRELALINFYSMRRSIHRGNSDQSAGYLEHLIMDLIIASLSYCIWTSPKATDT